MTERKTTATAKATAKRRSRSLLDDSQKCKSKGNVVQLVFVVEDEDVAGLATESGADGFEG